MAVCYDPCEHTVQNDIWNAPVGKTKKILKRRLASEIEFYLLFIILKTK